MMKLSARTVHTSRYPVLIGEGALDQFRKELKQYRKQKSKLFILTDANTLRFCLPELLSFIPELEAATKLNIDGGEEMKSLRTAEYLWKELVSQQADRNSLLINLGGGVVTDLGGYVASAFHRGIDTIHIPTSLISQIDAAIGSKTGVNVDMLKNQVGSFFAPHGVFVWPGFLSTLPSEQVRSGLAEVAKTALIRDEQFWRWLSRKRVKQILEIPFTDSFWKDLLLKTIRIKLEIVRHDPFERNIRKLLNFGHTIGHAIESLALRRETPVLHGEAVAAGMVCEGFLSVGQAGLDPHELDGVREWILDGFGKLPLLQEDESVRIDMMRHDKKNREQEIRFTLLSRIGQGRINQVCAAEQISEAFGKYYTL
ncbi:MAG: 3-dehydroquinate synthase [Bacteroidetes bacterium]|nr:MAG: 3-dehydroquinate synthase [Bacteroidota bacterium]